MNILIYIVVGLLFIILLWIIIISNRFKKMIVKIKEADSGIDVALSKRYNILTKMIDVVKAYSKYEQETFEKIVELRQGMSVKEKVIFNEKMNENFDKISLIAESYPELKANENYKLLQKSIIDAEEHLQAARRLYNSNVSIYNQAIAVFPNVIISKAKKLQEQDFFEASIEEKKEINV